MSDDPTQQFPDPYQQGPYQQGPFEQGPFEQGPQQQGPTEQIPYQQGPYQQGPYEQGQYQQGPTEQVPYQQGPYQQGPYEQGPYQGGPTEQVPYQQGPYQQGPYPPPQRPRRRRRGRVWAIIIPVAIVALLIGADRAAAAYAANQIAAKIQANGFPVKPGVNVEGFPFLTQVISKHLDGVVVTAPNFPVGPAKASVQLQATGISLNSGYNSGTVAHVTGTGLIGFSGLASIAGAAGAPGLSVSRAGPHTVKLSLNLQIVTASAIARITKVGRNEFSIRLISSNGVPRSLLGSIRHITVPIPNLPAGLAVQTVSVTGQGLLIRIIGTNVPFGNNP
jgi:hypothetical protein